MEPDRRGGEKGKRNGQKGGELELFLDLAAGYFLSCEAILRRSFLRTFVPRSPPKMKKLPIFIARFRASIHSDAPPRSPTRPECCRIGLKNEGTETVGYGIEVPPIAIEIH